MEEIKNKLELLLNELKRNQLEEQHYGKSLFNTQLFAIRVNEIYKLCNKEENYNE